MSTKQEEFYKELLADFKIEATEHSTNFTNNLLDLEREGDRVKRQCMIEVMFREIHSLKGAARAVNLQEIERLCQALENVMSKMKQGHLSYSSYLFDTFHNTINILNGLLTDLFEGQKTIHSEIVTATIVELSSIINSKTESNFPPPSIAQTEVKESSPAVEKPVVIETKEETPAKSPVIHANDEKTPIKETVRISTEKLSNILLQAEELITAKAILNNFVQNLNFLKLDINTKTKITENKKQLIQPLSSDADNLAWNELYNWQKENTKKTQFNLNLLVKDAEQFQRSVSRMVDDLLVDIKNTLLRPFSSVLDLFPKLVRDLSKEQNKDVNLNIFGNDIEIDRRILEEIKDPLIHILRNCIDHGIEKPEQRKAKNKPLYASINISLQQTNDQRLLIQISDDGQGINIDKVIASAIKEGAVTTETIEKLTEKELLKLIFVSGVTTSNFITNISGRGLGMAIVVDKVTQLGGAIDIESAKDKGTIFKINLPLSLATFRGIIFKIGNSQFIAPTNTVERVLKIKRSDINIVKNQETITVDGQVLILLQLSSILGVHHNIKNSRTDFQIHVLILSTGQKRVAFVVDEVIGEQEGTIKSLGTQLVNIRYISGATIMGDGKIVPVLNVSELMDVSKIARNQTLYNTSLKASEDIGNTSQSILVVEDSLTSRTLLRNLLETAGYDVKIAVDGMEAFTMINNENFDLIVSDIEMPRMNGFELTEKIRADKQFSNLPVIIVTSLDSPEDKLKGMDVGANAYCVKSSFDQSNLLEIIQRLI